MVRNNNLPLAHSNFNIVCKNYSHLFFFATLHVQVEYHDILWDIGYAKTWAEASELMTNLYAERPPLDDFLAWRDLRVMDEIHWYG